MGAYVGIVHPRSTEVNLLNGLASWITLRECLGFASSFSMRSFIIFVCCQLESSAFHAFFHITILALQHPCLFPIEAKVISSLKVCISSKHEALFDPFPKPSLFPSLPPPPSYEFPHRNYTPTPCAFPKSFHSIFQDIYTQTTNLTPSNTR